MDAGGRLAARWRGTVGDLRGRAAMVVLGCLICQMGLGFGYIFAPLAKDIMAEMGWTRAMYSFTRVPQLAVMAFASPVIGTLTVRYGARPILLVGVVALGTCFLMVSRVSSLYGYYAMLMFLGVALTCVGDVTVGQGVSRWVKERRGLALSIVYVGSNLGGLLLVPLAVWIAEQQGWRQSFIALGLGALCLMLPVTGLLVRDRGEVPVREQVEGGAPARVGRARSDLRLRDALRTPSFWILFYSLFAFFFYFLALLEHLVLFLTDEGMARDDAVTRYVTAISLGIVSKLTLGLIVDRIHERQALLLDFGLLTLSSLLLLLLPQDLLIWLFVISFGFSYAARDVVYPLIVTRCFGLGHMAEIYGLLMLTLILGAGGPFFAGWVHDRFGSYDVAFRVFAVLNLIATASLLFLRDERARRG
jgi:predicted MFS family arabinose efflux permease